MFSDGRLCTKYTYLLEGVEVSITEYAIEILLEILLLLDLLGDLQLNVPQLIGLTFMMHEQ